MAYSSSATDRLAAVREAIGACLTAQAYGVRGRNKQMADLTALRTLEKELMEEVAAESSGPMFQLMQRVDVE